MEELETEGKEKKSGGFLGVLKSFFCDFSNYCCFGSGLGDFFVC